MNKKRKQLVEAGNAAEIGGTIGWFDVNLALREYADEQRAIRERHDPLHEFMRQLLQQPQQPRR